MLRTARSYSVYISSKTSSIFGSQDDSSTITLYTTSWVMFFKGENHVTFGAESRRAGVRTKGTHCEGCDVHALDGVNRCQFRGNIMSGELFSKKCRSELINRSLQSHSGLIRSCCFSLHSCESSRRGLTVARRKATSHDCCNKFDALRMSFKPEITVKEADSILNHWQMPRFNRLAQPGPGQHGPTPKPESEA